ncbi:hypothetical protein L596_015350 [Steinernema carpocapsae]|uniref:Uncharacterized protein n=1 Tax=Steinernema carpocapsae TaxID=34508 RepID=A0A4U5NEQ0_STECR|nr:hypothetical protein L596_015350 [Steinernema carpocapsae]
MRFGLLCAQRLFPDDFRSVVIRSYHKFHVLLHFSHVDEGEVRENRRLFKENKIQLPDLLWVRVHKAKCKVRRFREMETQGSFSISVNPSLAWNNVHRLTHIHPFAFTAVFVTDGAFEKCFLRSGFEQIAVTKSKTVGGFFSREKREYHITALFGL